MRKEEFKANMQDMIMTKAIIFDLSEVYLAGLLGLEDSLEPLLKEPAKEIHEKFHNEKLTLLFSGKISEVEYWRSLIRQNSWDIKIPTLKRLIRANFTEIKGTREIIEELKTRGFKLGLLSVHAKEWIEFCEKKYDYHKLFDEVVYSFEIGKLKPAREPFEEILKRLKIKAQECIFIDDSKRNLSTADSLGIKTIHFKNPEQLRKDLILLSIKP